MVTRKSGRTVFAGDDRLAVLRATYKHHLALQWHLLLAMEQIWEWACVRIFTRPLTDRQLTSHFVFAYRCVAWGGIVLWSQSEPHKVGRV